MKKGFNLLLKYAHSDFDGIPVITGEDEILNLIQKAKKEVLEQPTTKELRDFRAWLESKGFPTWDLKVNPIRKFLEFRLSIIKLESKEK